MAKRKYITISLINARRNVTDQTVPASVHPSAKSPDHGCYPRCKIDFAVNFYQFLRTTAIRKSVRIIVINIYTR